MKMQIAITGRVRRVSDQVVVFSSSLVLVLSEAVLVIVIETGKVIDYDYEHDLIDYELLIVCVVNMSFDT